MKYKDSFVAMSNYTFVVFWALEPIFCSSCHEPKFKAVFSTSGMTAEPEQDEKARGHFAQMRNRLQKACMPAIQLAGCCDTVRPRVSACMYIAAETGHLKKNFKC